MTLNVLSDLTLGKPAVSFAVLAIMVPPSPSRSAANTWDSRTSAKLYADYPSSSGYISAAPHYF